MRLSIALLPYRLLLPCLFIAAFPGWVIKMLRRGGFGTRLGERAALYSTPPDFEPCGAVHVHAVSVGETMLALKLIRAWRERDPKQTFVLATGTATGHQVGTQSGIDHLRVTYAPLDFPSMVRRYLNRFEPTKLVLIEGEAWPHLLLACHRRSIPVALVNARMSPRSARRYRRFAAWVRPVYRLLDAVAIQEREDSSIWRDLGVPAERIQHTGSLKFDPGTGEPPTRRAEFQELLDRFGKSRPVVLAASTHAGESAWIAQAVRDATADATIAIAPRHAERRQQVKEELEQAGFQVALRSQKDSLPDDLSGRVLVIDSTGELRDWTAHADAVVIGKSFLSTGGQNPSEAIRAGKPVIFGRHMENFEPLASRLVTNQGALVANDRKELANAILNALNPQSSFLFARNAGQVLQTHEGATQRIINLLQATH